MTASPIGGNASLEPRSSGKSVVMRPIATDPCPKVHTFSFQAQHNTVLSSVTDKGVVGGLATSGRIYAKKRLAARRAGIHYRWVLFKEDAEQLAYLGEAPTRIRRSSSAIEACRRQHSLISHYGTYSALISSAIRFMTSRVIKSFAFGSLSAISSVSAVRPCSFKVRRMPSWRR